MAEKEEEKIAEKEEEKIAEKVSYIEEKVADIPVSVELEDNNQI